MSLDKKCVKLTQNVFDICIADFYRMEVIDPPFNNKKTNVIKQDLLEILTNNFQLIKNTEKKGLENKDLKVLFNNLSHLVLGKEDWNETNKGEAAKLLYGINYWVLKDGGPKIIDFMILNDVHVEFVFLFTQLFDKYL
ncbi:hypothetical protein NCER_101001 [Vairimorpha ceranae BRL01]|uniref:Uncharacterized protein n=2 Tax=Vairimorpha ceranae TaxID=40302 RepID=C4V8Z3_VAIC1|nr:hypothetical protein AAJ76_3500038381 [Vairimorpha ceranae]EEQ82306.1 hypothetical protein NCER_101001 [Vairimorpha ceranae BRL01]KAF5139956.1 hypothetical protein G9O61_00g018760 [Vairimorpha ceranae]KKO75042.1 hypothetical protein AAJ76_3500038381 [Vairimorpha ceranae]